MVTILVLLIVAVGLIAIAEHGWAKADRKSGKR